MANLASLFSDAARGAQFKATPPKLPELVGVKGTDRAFVELAVDQDDGITLVTTDRRLVAAVNSLGFPDRYGFTVRSPEEALSALS
ncbi:MAG: hypothetical protein AAB289_10930 [Chloroflexota bacterium]